MIKVRYIARIKIIGWIGVMSLVVGTGIVEIAKYSRPTQSGELIANPFYHVLSDRNRGVVLNMPMSEFVELIRSDSSCSMIVLTVERPNDCPSCISAASEAAHIIGDSMDVDIVDIDMSPEDGVSSRNGIYVPLELKTHLYRNLRNARTPLVMYIDDRGHVVDVWLAEQSVDASRAWGRFLDKLWSYYMANHGCSTGNSVSSSMN